MFRDDRQRGQVCFILTAWVRDSPWRWTETGYRPAGPMPKGLSTGETKMLRFAQALWSGDDLLVWQGFDGRRMQDIGQLLVAYDEGPESLDGWIEMRSPGRRLDDGVNERLGWETAVRARSRT